MRRRDFGFGDAHYFAIQLRPLSNVEVRVDGKDLPVPHQTAGSVQLLDQRRVWQAIIHPPFETVNLSIGHDLLARLAEEGGLHDSEIIAAPFAGDRRDPTLLALAHALLPAFERPLEMSALFAESITTAAAVHILGEYCNRGDRLALSHGGLAPWQQRCAVELIHDSIDGDIGLTELAAACGISPGHFARSFRRSLGMSPHRWLMLERVRRAQDLLANSATPISAVALACGFADQSHLGRVFSSVIGMPPGAWRRLQRH